MWRVVHFLAEETVAAVPIQWVLSEDSCRWPTITVLKLRSAISKCQQPDESWPIYKCRLLGGIYGDLSTARMKALQAEQESDLNSDAEVGFGHRKLMKNRKYQTDLLDIDSGLGIGKKNKNNEISGTDSDDDEGGEDYQPLEMPIMKIDKSSSSFVSGLNNNIIIEYSTPVNSVSESAALTRSADAIEKITAVGNSNTADPVTNEKETYKVFADENFKRQILRQMSIINFKLDQITEDFGKLYRNNMNSDETQQIEESIFDKFNFPLKTIGELKDLDTYLEIVDNKTKVVYELSKIGGSNHKLMTKRLMEKLIANVLAMKYSWLGFKKKENFSALNIAIVVKESVMRIHKKTITESDVESAIKGWLVKAKEREEKTQK